MRKYIILLLICCICITNASAATMDENHKTAATTLEYSLSNSYTVIIPESVTFNGNTATIPISMNITSIGYDECLSLYVSSPNYRNNTWNLKNEKYAAYQQYELKFSKTKIYPNVRIAYLWPPDDDYSWDSNLTATISSTQHLAGTYTDTLNFTVAIEGWCVDCYTPTAYGCKTCHRCPDCVYLCEEHGLCSECEVYTCVNGIHCVEECTCDAECPECGSTKSRYTVQCAFCGLCEDCAYICTTCTNWHCPSHNVCSCGKCLESGECDD